MPFKPGQSGNVSTQFKKGQSGNPNGMPKGYKTFSARLREALEREISYVDFDSNKKRMEGGDALATMLIAQALYKKDMVAANIILNHVDKDLAGLTPLLVQNNITQNNPTTNVLGLSDKKVLAIAAILEEEDIPEATG